MFRISVKLFNFGTNIIKIRQVIILRYAIENSPYGLILESDLMKFYKQTMNNTRQHSQDLSCEELKLLTYHLEQLGLIIKVPCIDRNDTMIDLKPLYTRERILKELEAYEKPSLVTELSQTFSSNKAVANENLLLKRSFKNKIWKFILCFNGSQLVLFSYLTFSLGWDVMEPVCYFSFCATQSILLYLYFLRYNQDYSHINLDQQLKKIKK